MYETKCQAWADFLRTGNTIEAPKSKLANAYFLEAMNLLALVGLAVAYESVTDKQLAETKLNEVEKEHLSYQDVRGWLEAIKLYHKRSGVKLSEAKAEVVAYCMGKYGRPNFHQDA